MVVERLRSAIFVLLSILLAAALLPAHAGAQELEGDPDATLEGDLDEPETAAGKGIEEITISARKREERLQDVPISVSAFSGANLDEQKIFDVLDVQFQVPNMLFGKTNFTGANFQIRGIGTAVVSASGESAVGTHINTVPVLTSRLFEAEYYDTERIEILRGPQGTLFGRTSTGGSFNLYTRKPGEEWGGDAEFTYGNYNTFRLKGAINMPVHEKFRMRFAGMFLDRDGFIYNISTNSNVDDRRLYALRGSFQIDITDDTQLDLMGSWFRESDNRSRIGKQKCTTDGNPSNVSLGCRGDLPLQFNTLASHSTLGGILESYALAGINPAFALYAPGVDANAGAINPPDLRTHNSRINPSYTADEGFAMADLHHNFKNLTASWVTGYQYTKVESNQDYNMTRPALAWDPAAVAAINATFGIPTNTSGTGLCLGVFGCTDRSWAQDESTAETTVISSELRVTSDYDGPINFTAGAIYIYGSTQTSYKVFFSGAEVLGRITKFANPDYNPEANHFNSETDYAITNSFGLFGEVYWDITDTTKLTAGARYINDRKDVKSRNYLLNYVPTTPDRLPPYNFQDASWNDGTFRVTLDQQIPLDFMDQSMVYGSISRGFKPGGFNPPAVVGATVPDTFDPETVYAFEIGTKNEYFDRRVQTNITAFFYLYNDYQVSKIVERTSVNENINANVWGLEAEFVFVPIDNSRIDFSVAYLGSSIKDSASIDPANPTAGVPGWISAKNLADASNFICDTTRATPCNTFAPPPLGGPLSNAQYKEGNLTVLSGNELPNSPNVQIFVSGQYTFELPYDTSLTPRISYYWQSEMYGRMFNTVADRVDSWSSADFGLRFVDDSGRFSVTSWYLDFWMKNFMNNDFITGHYLTDASSGNFTNVFVMDPRTIGITIGANF
jgi:outer membrane receptor protein involved in Fe transport